MGEERPMTKEGDEMDLAATDSHPHPFWRQPPPAGHRDWLLRLRRDGTGVVVRGGVLAVAFAGLGEAAAPVFEFKGALLGQTSAGGAHHHCLFLRDSNLQWYLPNRAFFAAVIGAAAAAAGAARLVFVGASAGGFAALFFQARYFPAADVAAFSPQAFLDSATREHEEDVSLIHLENPS
jgi:hypothetical protein